jgi:hypothetical protein
MDAKKERNMEIGLVALAPAGEIAMLVRALFGLVILCSAVPVILGMWTSRARSESDDSPDLDALWKRYKRGEISWDDYLRVEVEGTRGLAGIKEGPSGDLTPDDAVS